MRIVGDRLSALAPVGAEARTSATIALVCAACDHTDFAVRETADAPAGSKTQGRETAAATALR
jgi:hypothetical protein